MMNYANTVAQNDMTFSYHPMPFFNDVESKSTFNKKLDLNLYCIKRPQQNLFYSCYQSEYACLGN